MNMIVHIGGGGAEMSGDLRARALSARFYWWPGSFDERAGVVVSTTAAAAAGGLETPLPLECHRLATG